MASILGSGSSNRPLRTGSRRAPAPWLALHDLRFVQLGSLTATSIPWLLGLPGKFRLTAGLLDAGALCLLTAGQAEPATDLADARPLPLSIRAFGDEALAKTLVDLVETWTASGRPGTSGLRMTALPIDETYRPEPGAFVVDKRWSRLVLSW